MIMMIVSNINSPFDLCDQHVFDVTVGGALDLALDGGGAELPEDVLGSVRIENGQLLQVEDDVGHGPLTQVLGCERSHHVDTGSFCVDKKKL